MEEKTTETSQPEVVETKSAEKEIRLSSKLFYTLFGAVSLALMILCKVLLAFGVYNKTLYGVFSVVIYVLPALGLVFSYLSEHKTTSEFWVNVFALAVALVGF